MALITAYLNAKVILVVTVYIAIGILSPSLPPPTPPYALLPVPSRLSLMVSVDVKPHVYLLRITSEKSAVSLLESGE